jgi:hypothetical protein
MSNGILLCVEAASPAGHRVAPLCALATGPAGQRVAALAAGCLPLLLPCRIEVQLLLKVRRSAPSTRLESSCSSTAAIDAARSAHDRGRLGRCTRGHAIASPRNPSRCIFIAPVRLTFCRAFYDYDTLNEWLKDWRRRPERGK